MALFTSISTWFSGSRLGVALVKLIHSYWSKRLKLTADWGFVGDGTIIRVFNHSTKKINIVYFEVYNADKPGGEPFREGWTPYSEGDSPVFTIESDGYVEWHFEPPNNIGSLFGLRENVFLRLVTSEEKVKIIQLQKDPSPA